MVDNISAINFAKNSIAYERSKHIEMKLRYCKSEYQVIDQMSHNWSVQEIEEDHGHGRLGTLELRWYIKRKNYFTFM